MISSQYVRNQYGANNKFCNLCLCSAVAPLQGHRGRYEAKLKFGGQTQIQDTLKGCEV